LPTNVVQIIDRLNALNKDAVDVCERPAARPNMVDLGETTAFISDAKAQLARLGVKVQWNRDKRIYDVVRD
jgi:hypothetical protein